MFHFEHSNYNYYPMYCKMGPNGYPIYEKEKLNGVIKKSFVPADQQEMFDKYEVAPQEIQKNREF